MAGRPRVREAAMAELETDIAPGRTPILPIELHALLPRR